MSGIWTPVSTPLTTANFGVSVAVSLFLLSDFSDRYILGLDAHAEAGVHLTAVLSSKPFAEPPELPITYKKSRQQRRREEFRKAFAKVCSQYGGGPNWSGPDNLLRGARRKIARRLLKRAEGR